MISDKTKRILKATGLTVLVLFYLLAGLNHFLRPAGYIRIIPSYIPYPHLMNYLSGGCEMLFAILVVPAFSRPIAGWLILLMLVAFIPVHVTMALDAPVRVGSITVTPFAAWLRVAFQPVLMYWAWWNTRPVKHKPPSKTLERQQKQGVLL